VTEKYEAASQPLPEESAAISDLMAGFDAARKPQTARVNGYRVVSPFADDHA
jgi:hypothetical protein